MPKTMVMLSAADQGRLMSLAEFDQAFAQEGLRFELGRGVVTVIDVPGRKHLAQVNALRRQIHAYDATHSGVIHTIAGSSECKVLVAGFESERHPDVAIYKAPPPRQENFWATWIPEIVVEVVSPGGEQRDYVEKRDEYLEFGITEYWIFDAARREMRVLTRSAGRWTEQVVKPSETHASPLLPGCEIDCGAVFAAADNS